MSTPRWRVARAGTVLLLAASGVLMVMASVARWWPACAPGHAGGDACLAVQDHRYDVWFMAAPWRPLGPDAQLYGAATLLLATAFVVLPTLVTRGHASRTAQLGGAVLALTFAVQGGQTVLAGLTGQAVDVAVLRPLWVLQVVLLPVVLTVLVRQGRRAGRRPTLNTAAGVVLLAALTTTDPLARALIAVGPYDSRPWHEAVFGAALVLAAAALWPVSSPTSPSRVIAVQSDSGPSSATTCQYVPTRQ